MPDAISWGDVQIAAVIDWVARFRRPPALPGPAAGWEQHRGWLSIGLWIRSQTGGGRSIARWFLPDADGSL